MADTRHLRNKKQVQKERLRQQVHRAVTALYQYLEKQKESESEMIWDDEMDINLVIEPKVITKKNVVYNALRMYVHALTRPLALSLSPFLSLFLSNSQQNIHFF